MAGGARGVAQRARRALVERRPVELGGVAGDEGLVGGQRALHRVRHRRVARHHHDALDAGDLALEHLQQRQQRRVDEQQPVRRVVDDVLELLREQPRVDRVHHGADARHRVVELEVAVVVPGQRGDAVARLHARGHERVGELPRAAEHLAPGAAVPRRVQRHRDDLDVRVVAVREPHDVGDQERPLHHESQHVVSPALKSSEDLEGPFVGDQPDARILAAAVATLEEAVGDQPDAHHLAGRAADDPPVVGVQVAFLGVPLAEAGATGAHDHVRLLVLPVRQRAAIHGTDRQRGAPVVGEVLAVVEFDRDAEVVVRGQGVFGEVDGQLVHAPAPAEARAGHERATGRTTQDADVAMGVAADRGPSVRGGGRTEDLARTELPQVFPVLRDGLRLVEALRLGQHEARHAQVPARNRGTVPVRRCRVASAAPPPTVRPRPSRTRWQACRAGRSGPPIRRGNSSRATGARSRAP